jgi:hypothetical protein
MPPRFWGRFNLTETRLVYVCPTRDPSPGESPGGHAAAGQIRYPWVCMLEFAAKHNWVTDETLRLFYEDDRFTFLV